MPRKVRAVQSRSVRTARGSGDIVRCAARRLQAGCHLGLGKLYRRIGRVDEARAELATAVAMLREMGMAYWLPEAEGELTEAT